MTDELRPPSIGGSLLWRIAIGALVLFVALTVIGWVVGAVLSLLRAAVVLAAVAAIGWVLLRGIGRD